MSSQPGPDGSPDDGHSPGAAAGGDAAPDRSDDPVRIRRAKVARLTSVGQRIGYGLFAVAVVAFFVGLVEGFSAGVVDLILGCLAVGSVVLAPSIVFAYAVKAAEREDLEQGR